MASPPSTHPPSAADGAGARAGRRALGTLAASAALGAAGAERAVAQPPAPAPAVAAPAAAEVRVNQVGFFAAGPKIAVVVAGRADSAPARFAVRPAAGGAPAFVGALGPPRWWGPSGEWARLADFGALARPGRYVLVVDGAAPSPAFTVGGEAPRGLARAALKAFYFQRAGAALPAAYAGPWARPAGHPDTVVLVHPSAATAARPAGTRISAPRGWYDAGDYNKYVVNSGISTATLLALAEHFPAYAGALGTNIPESNNALPDVVDEALWNVRWMLAMQDPADGGVYHKLTTAEFSGFVMPNADTAARYVVQKGTAAALDFAAVAAQAARVARRYPRALPGLADTLAATAGAAWRWARAHPDSAYDQDRVNREAAPPVRTGAYGDAAFGDEFRWAAAELWATGGSPGADSLLAVALAPAPSADVPSWASVGTLGLYTLLDHRRALPASADTLALRRRLTALADTLVARARRSAYGVPMEAADFVWGSSAVAANQGVVLVQAYRLTADTAYLGAAAAALDYVLGRNATGYSFVTGFGARAPLHPHHRPSAADTVAAPVPGLLAGGPNPGQQDGCAGYPSRLPARSYVDSTCAYAANEVAINWNAPLAYLAAALDAVYGDAGRVPGRGRRGRRLGARRP